MSTTSHTYECERDDEVRSFNSFAECQRFVRREGDQSRLWSYVGRAQGVYELGFEPTPAQVREHFEPSMTAREIYQLRH